MCSLQTRADQLLPQRSNLDEDVLFLKIQTSVAFQSSWPILCLDESWRAV